MKLLLTLAAATCLLASCNNDGNKEAATEGTSVMAAGPNIVYPYTPEKPYRGWQMGSEENTVVAMKALKSWEDGDYANLAATLSDSVDLRFDGFQEKMSHDSAVSFLKTAREKYKDVKITMHDWESVISADKKDEYVTLWYKQVWTDNKGVKDSVNVVDDCKISNGKLIELDEKVQRFASAKK